MTNTSRKLYELSITLLRSLRHETININRKTVVRFIIALLIFAVVTPVLAAYIGPNRKTEETKLISYDYGVWAKKYDGTCNPTYNPPACIVCGWEYSPGSPCGDAEYWYKLGTKTKEVTVATDLPPATISSVLQNCTLNNGWCNTALPSLSLSGYDPLPGYSITVIEGTRNSQPFSCSGTSCNAPLVEGNNDFTFWAVSSYGDSSAMGTLTAKVDITPPLFSTVTSGTSGNSGWYVGDTTTTVSASDTLSGVGNIQYNQNSSGWQNGSSIASSEGVNSVFVRVYDVAGNIATGSMTIKVDTAPPVISPSISGTTGSNGWLISSGTVSAVASDTTSGTIGEVAISVNGDAWQNVPVVLNDGIYAISFRSYDVAGNQGTAALNVSIDTTQPIVNFVYSGTAGLNGWYSSNVAVSGSASDSLSDVDKYEVRADGGGWSSSVVLSDGVHKLEARAYDKAGNVNIISNTLRIDTTQPLSAYTSHVNNDVVSNIVPIECQSSDANLQFVEISFDGGTTWQTTNLSGDVCTYDWDTSSVPNGIYTVYIRAIDAAGNTENPVPLDLIVNNQPPIVKITDWWWVWDSGEFRVSPNTFAVGNITVTISDPDKRWGSVKMEYDPGLNFGTVTWDRHFTEGIVAPMGDYRVEVVACDVYGNCASDRGTIKIPILAPVLPTATLSPVPSPTPVFTATPMPSPMPPADTPVPQMTLVAVEPVVHEKTVAGRRAPIAPILAIVSFISLLWALSSSALVDPRPRAILDIVKTISQKKDVL